MRSWDGVEWQTHVLPTALTFWAIWGSSDGVIYVAGTALNGSGMVLRGNGEEGVAPSGYVGPSVRDIWGSSSDNVWVAAYEGGFQHWDGASWSEFEAPEEARVMGGHGVGDARAFAVGLRGLILHFDGEAWSPEASGTDKTLMSVWAAGDDDAWAVGSDATVLHWNGDEWFDTGRQSRDRRDSSERRSRRRGRAAGRRSRRAAPWAAPCAARRRPAARARPRCAAACSRARHRKIGSNERPSTST